MRTGHVSLAALATAAALTIGAPVVTATTPSAPVPGPVGINWPPQPPPFSATAATGEPKPEAATPPEAAKAPPAADVVPPSVVTLPQTAPAIDAPKVAVFSLGEDLVARLKGLKPSDAKARADRDAAVKGLRGPPGRAGLGRRGRFHARRHRADDEIRGADSYGLQASAFKLPTETWAPGAKPTAGAAGRCRSGV